MLIKIQSTITILSCLVLNSFRNVSTQMAAIRLVRSGGHFIHVAPRSCPSLTMVNGLIQNFTDHQHHLLTGLASGHTMVHRDQDPCHT